MANSPTRQTHFSGERWIVRQIAELQLRFAGRESAITTIRSGPSPQTTDVAAIERRPTEPAANAPAAVPACADCEVRKAGANEDGGGGGVIAEIVIRVETGFQFPPVIPSAGRNECT